MPLVQVNTFSRFSCAKFAMVSGQKKIKKRGERRKSSVLT